VLLISQQDAVSVQEALETLIGAGLGSMLGTAAEVPSEFVGRRALRALCSRVGRDQPDLRAVLTLTAQARVVLGRWIPHHQPSSG